MCARVSSSSSSLDVDDDPDDGVCERVDGDQESAPLMTEFRKLDPLLLPVPDYYSDASLSNRERERERGIGSKIEEESRRCQRRRNQVKLNERSFIKHKAKE